MLLSVLISVSISAIILAALLLLTRRRLARQFEDIQRRLLESERTLSSIKLSIDRSTTHAQLQRLHLGLVRVQENAACRHDSLAPVSPRSLTELELAALQDWAVALGVPLEAEQIKKLSRAIACVETLSLLDAQIETPDLLACLIALLAQPERNVAIALSGKSSASLAPLLKQMTPGFFDTTEVSTAPNGSGSLNAVVADADASDLESLADRVRAGGVLVLQDAAGATRVERNFPGFELVAGEWNTRVYQKGAEE